MAASPAGLQLLVHEIGRGRNVPLQAGPFGLISQRVMARAVAVTVARDLGSDSSLPN